MRQVSVTSLGDNARETLTIAGLENAKERSPEHHLRLRASQSLTVLRANVGSVFANDGGVVQSAHANGNWRRDVNVCRLWQSWTRESEVSIPHCEVQQLWQDWTSPGDAQTT